MKDYALRLAGLPCLEGALRIEEELKDAVFPQAELRRNGSVVHMSESLRCCDLFVVPRLGKFAAGDLADCHRPCGGWRLRVLGLSGARGAAAVQRI